MKKPATSVKGKALVQKTNGAGVTKKAPLKKVSADQEKKWANLSLDEFINSSASDDEEGTNSEGGDDSELDSSLDGEEIDSEEADGEELDDEDLDEEEGDSLDGEEADGEEDSDEEESDSENEGEGEVSAKEHKKTLSKLKESDPEFYQFLSENDRALLEFDSSDSDEEERGGQVHELPKPDELEVASDDSDFEDKESTVKRASNVITQAMVDKWQLELKNPKCIKTIADVVNAFRSAVHSVTEEKAGVTRFVVQGTSAFNAVVRLCIVHLIPAVKRFLKVEPEEKINLERCKSWVKVRLHVKAYLADVIRLLASLTESSLLSVILKHIHQLIPFYSAFVKLSKVLCKRLVSLWSSADDTIRVVAFLSLLRLGRTLSTQLLEPIIKAMYLSYARNCKFTSPSTWPVINFMRRSLVELMALQETLTYKHAFLYIRQLAIHLRNAVTLNKKDSLMTVYNWQFVHCLHLWAALLGAVPDSQLLKPLIYPLVQIAIGTINLVPTGRHFPLRFHIVTILNQLSIDSNVFIPVLPFLLEVMQNYNFEKKPSKTSMKPLELSCVLRVSQSQMSESGYRDAVIDLLYDRVLETLVAHSHSCSFPELALPAILQLKLFIKKCKHANYSKKLKQLLEKIKETASFVEQKRASVHFELADSRAVVALENQMKQEGTPMSIFHSSWKKMKDRETSIKIAKRTESAGEMNIPVVKKHVAKSRNEDDDDMDELFPSDISDDEIDDEDRFLTVEERGTKRQKYDDQEESINSSAKKARADEETKKAQKKKKKVVAPVVEEEEGEQGDEADQVVDFNMSSSDEDESEEGEEESENDD